MIPLPVTLGLIAGAEVDLILHWFALLFPSLSLSLYIYFHPFVDRGG